MQSFLQNIKPVHHPKILILYPHQNPDPQNNNQSTYRADRVQAESGREHQKDAVRKGWQTVWQRVTNNRQVKERLEQVFHIRLISRWTKAEWTEPIRGGDEETKMKTNRISLKSGRGSWQFMETLEKTWRHFRESKQIYGNVFFF